MNCITLYCACTDMPAAAPSDLKCSTSCSAVHFSASYGFCGVVPKLEGGECCWGNSFSTDSICFTRANCIGFTTLQSGIPIVSERGSVVVSGWLGIGVDDVCGIPGSFPPAGRLPVPQWRAHGTHQPQRCGKLLVGCDADSRNFGHFLLSSESPQTVPKTVRPWEMISVETWKPVKSGESNDDQSLIFDILRKRASHLFTAQGSYGIASQVTNAWQNENQWTNTKQMPNKYNNRQKLILSSKRPILGAAVTDLGALSSVSQTSMLGPKHHFDSDINIGCSVDNCNDNVGYV